MNLEVWAIRLKHAEVIGKFHTNHIRHESKKDILTKLRNWYNPLSLNYNMLIYFDNDLLAEIFGEYGLEGLDIWKFSQLSLKSYWIKFNPILNCWKK